MYYNINDDNNNLQFSQYARDYRAEIVRWIGCGEMEWEATRPKQTIFQFALNILQLMNRTREKWFPDRGV